MQKTRLFYKIKTTLLIIYEMFYEFSQPDDILNSSTEGQPSAMSTDRWQAARLSFVKPITDDNTYCFPGTVFRSSVA